MTARAVEVAGVRYAYPDGKQALNGIDLSVDAGERVAILGPNGAGKTTLALHLNGLYRVTEGSISIGGLTIDDATLREVRRRVGLVFQDANDQLFMPTIREDVAFGPANMGLTAREIEARVAQALASVDAADLIGRVPHHLSGGEKRKAALATVLAMQPDLLVLDEPTSGLDPATRRELIELLTTIDVTQLIVTHDLPLAYDLCPRSVIMDGGRIVAAGPTRELLADAALLARHRLEMPFPPPDATLPPSSGTSPTGEAGDRVDGER
jgi:cobalt/nickel transport system ATP-binding protein